MKAEKSKIEEYFDLAKVGFFHEDKGGSAFVNPRNYVKANRFLLQLDALNGSTAKIANALCSLVALLEDEQETKSKKTKTAANRRARP